MLMKMTNAELVYTEMGSNFAQKTKSFAKGVTMSSQLLF